MYGAAAGPCPVPLAGTLVVGVGARRGAPLDEVLGLIEKTLLTAGLRTADIVELATVEAKAAEPGIVGAAARLGVPVRTHTAEALAGVLVPNPSGAPGAAVGTPSVAEGRRADRRGRTAGRQDPVGARDGSEGGRDVCGGPSDSGHPCDP
ncbi:hypothetical protein ACVWXU_007187 [Streptomyces sp. TE33382]